MIPKRVENAFKERYGDKLVLPAEIDLRVPKAEAWDGSEHSLQREFFSQMVMLTVKHPELILDLHLAHAIPNGGKRSIREGLAFKAEGVKGGVPDVFIPLPSFDYSGLYIEFKNGTGKPSTEQRCFLLHLHERQYKCVIVNTLEAAMGTLTEYLNAAW